MLTSTFRLALVLLALGAPAPARAQTEAPTPSPLAKDVLKPVTQVPGSWPRDVPLPQGVKPVAAGERLGGLIVLFQGGGKAEPMRAAYEAELPKRGWAVEGTDKIGDEQGIFAVHGERTLSILLREVGPELRIQISYVPKTPGKSPPTAK